MKKINNEFKIIILLMKNYLLVLDQNNDIIFEGKLKNPLKDISKKVSIQIEDVDKDYIIIIDGIKRDFLVDSFQVCVLYRKKEERLDLK